jgi:hypothetical protein
MPILTKIKSKKMRDPLFFITLTWCLLSGLLLTPSLSAQEPRPVFSAQPIKEPRIIRASTLIGYGLVNNWFLIDPDQLGKLLSRNGLTLTEIEYVAWFDDEGRKGLSIRTDVEAAKRFVTIMRRYSITTLISVVNWNCEVPRKASNEWFLKQVQEIIDQIGPDLVLLLPISEPDDSKKAKEWQETARSEWPGKIVLNGPGGRGLPEHTRKMDFLDWHWCKDFDPAMVLAQLSGIEVINNTDCGPVINPGPLRAGLMTLAALGKKAHFLVYDFDGSKIDEPVIHAMVEAIRQSRPGGD